MTEAHRVSWHDSLILAAALEGECEKLYTEDFQKGRTIDGLRIENPFS
jgi:predicted nucleic acid-binding protein